LRLAECRDENFYLNDRIGWFAPVAIRATSDSPIARRRGNRSKILSFTNCDDCGRLQMLSRPIALHRSDVLKLLVCCSKQPGDAIYVSQRTWPWWRAFTLLYCCRDRTTRPLAQKTAKRICASASIWGRLRAQSNACFYRCSMGVIWGQRWRRNPEM